MADVLMTVTRQAPAGTSMPAPVRFCTRTLILFVVCTYADQSAPERSPGGERCSGAR